MAPIFGYQWALGPFFSEAGQNTDNFKDRQLY